MRTVVGIHSCLEALMVRPRAIKKVILKNTAKDSQDYKDIIAACERNRLRVDYASEGVLDKIARTHQGIALEVTDDPKLNWESLGQEQSEIIVAIDGIEDPHNLGAMIRTAWLLGAKGMIVTKHRTAGLTPAVNKVASGGVEHLPVEFHANLAPILKELKEKGFWVYGLSEKAKQPLYRTQFSDKVVWLVGSEESGIRKPYLDLCDELISIPQVHARHSYNASVALSIAVSETYRQMQKIQ